RRATAPRRGWRARRPLRRSRAARSLAVGAGLLRHEGAEALVVGEPEVADRCGQALGVARLAEQLLAALEVSALDLQGRMDGLDVAAAVLDGLAHRGEG